MKKSVFEEKSVEELVKEANSAVREDDKKQPSQEELAEEEAEYGYFQQQ
jgi:hypothetical protein